MSKILEGIETAKPMLSEKAKKATARQQPQQAQQPQQSGTAILICPLYAESLAAHPDVRQKLDTFIQFKKNEPLRPFNKSDKSFVSGGNYDNVVPGLRHAHLTFDISVVYMLTGSNPRQLRLYGVFSHDELGVGQPASIPKQKTMAKRFSTQQFKTPQ